MPPPPAPAASQVTLASVADVARKYWLPAVLFLLGLFYQAVLLPSSYPQSHYDVLGLKRGTTVEAVEEAYSRLSEKWNGSKDEQRTGEILKVRYAYELLKNPIWKRDYDLFGIDEYQRGVFERLTEKQKAEDVPRKFDLPLLNKSPINLTERAFNKLTIGAFAAAIESDRPLLVQVYSSGSNHCIEFFDKWKRINNLLDGVADTAMVETGDVQLAANFAERKFAKLPFFRDGLPAIVGYPASCRAPECYMRYHGELSIDGTVDWVATTVVGLPRILYYSKEALVPKFIAKSGHNKVKVIIFSATGERAAPFLRQAALKYSSYAAFASVLWSEDESKYWLDGLGVESAPAVVFLKGPGVEPVVYHGHLTSSQFLELMEDHKHQGLPQLRSDTSDQLGCDARGHSRAGNDTPIWYCVIVAGRPSLELAKMREIVHRAEDRLHSDIIHSKIDELPLEPPVAAVAFQEKRLTFVWLDGEVQKKICIFYLGSDYAGTCGAQNIGDPDVVPRVFIVRFQRNSTDDTIRVERKTSPLMEALRGSRNQYASQLVARYNGSESVEEIIQWINKIIKDGDNRDIPYFTQKVPDFVPEEGPSKLSTSANAIRSSARTLDHIAHKLYLLFGDLLGDPRVGPALFMCACVSFGAIWIRSNQTNEQSSTQQDEAPTAGRPCRARSRPSTSTAARIPSITDFEPKDAHQFLSSGSDSD